MTKMLTGEYWWSCKGWLHFKFLWFANRNQPTKFLRIPESHFLPSYNNRQISYNKESGLLPVILKWNVLIIWVLWSLLSFCDFIKSSLRKIHQVRGKAISSLRVASLSYCPAHPWASPSCCPGQHRIDSHLQAALGLVPCGPPEGKDCILLIHVFSECRTQMLHG